MKQSKLIQAFEMERKDMKLTQVEVIEKAGLNPKVRQYLQEFTLWVK